MFLAQLRMCYASDGSVTVNEQLLLTGDQFSFRQYIPNRHEKYGIKIFRHCDSSTTCLLNDDVYL